MQTQLTQKIINETKDGTTINPDVQKLFDAFRSKSQGEKIKELRANNVILKQENQRLKAVLLAKVNSTNEKIKNELQKDMTIVLKELREIKVKTDNIEKRNAVDTEEKKIVELLEKLNNAVSGGTPNADQITDLNDKIRDFLKHEQTAEQKREIEKKNEKIKELETSIANLTGEKEKFEDILKTFREKAPTGASDAEKTFCETLCNYYYKSIDDLKSDSSSADSLKNLWNVLGRSIYKDNFAPKMHFPVLLMTSIVFVKLCEMFEKEPYNFEEMEKYTKIMQGINPAASLKKNILFKFLIYESPFEWSVLKQKIEQEKEYLLKNHDEITKTKILKNGGKYILSLKSNDKTDTDNAIQLISVPTKNTQSVLYNLYQKSELKNCLLQGLAIICLNILSKNETYKTLHTCVKDILETHIEIPITDDINHFIDSYIQCMMPENHTEYNKIKFAQKVYLQSLCLAVADDKIELYKSSKKISVFCETFKVKIEKTAETKPNHDIIVDIPDL
jgi:hypothetical protein